MIGKYRIVGQLGRGGMGTVYKALDETLDREVAIKVLNPELAESDVMKRFRAEATTLARLNHPEIATIYELYRSDTDLLMVMEFVKGETLDRLSERLGPLPPERAAYLVDKVLSALEHAHRAGVVHRDMKPANVMVTDAGGVKIMDFGIARVRGADHITVDGYMMGTPAYMPPEQVLGQEVDGRADLYSVGVVFYRLLTGALPFDADTAIGMVQKQLSDAPTPLRSRREGLPDWCEPLLQRALAKAPADRFQTAGEFREALIEATGVLGAEHAGAFSAQVEVGSPATPASHLGLPGAAALSPHPAGAPAGAPRGSTPVPAATTPLVSTVVLGTRHVVAMGVLLTVLTVGVAVLAWVAIRRPIALEPAGPPAAVAAAPTDRAVAQGQPSVAAPPVEQRAPRTGSGPPAGLGSAAAPPVAASSPGAAASLPPGGEPRPAPLGPAAAPARTFLPLAFDARAFMSSGGERRERDARVHLAEGRVTVTPDDSPSDVLHVAPYAGIVSISYSKGRDPWWNAPGGPAPVLRAGKGPLGGIFRGTRHWVTLRTRDAADPFIVLRFANDVEVNRALAALEERTGRAVDLVAEPKDSR